MKSIISKLYYGEICPCEEPVPRGTMPRRSFPKRAGRTLAKKTSKFTNAA